MVLSCFDTIVRPALDNRLILYQRFNFAGLLCFQTPLEWRPPKHEFFRLFRLSVFDLCNQDRHVYALEAIKIMLCCLKVFGSNVDRTSCLTNGKSARIRLPQFLRRRYKVVHS